jgi:dihydrofolate synthase/folylpolyglutamate synthase
MDYNQALEYIHGTYKLGSKLGLENIKDLLNRLDNPQDKFKYIHVAGTNGKGSVTAMLSHILCEGGYKVGTFVSPYLENFTERIQVNLQEIPRQELAHITQRVKEKVDEMVSLGRNHPTEFEIVTAIGLVYFAQQKIDIAVVEVGLGGRLDSTNVVDEPLLSIITSIDFDHMNILGNTLGEIAFEKAGIIKKGRPVVSYPQLEEAFSVIQEVARDRNAPLYEVSPGQISPIKISPKGSIFNFRFRDIEYKDLILGLIGEHQLKNAATALTAIEVIRSLGIVIPKQAIYSGLSNTRWPGRLEKVMENPSVIIDGAHNSSGAEALAQAINTYFADDEIILVIGILGDKEVDAIISKLCPLAHRVIVTRPDNPRAMKPEELGKKVLRYSHTVEVEPNITKAIDKAIDLSGQQGVVLICGSLYLAGIARSYLMNWKDNR